MVYNASEYWYKGMDNQKPYYFTIEAINENGVSTKSPIMKVE
jgi:xylan 1,4-beta-xylosidase